MSLCCNNLLAVLDEMSDCLLYRFGLVVTAGTKSKCRSSWMLQHSLETNSITLKTEAVLFSETLQQTYRLTRFNNQQDRHFDTTTSLKFTTDVKCREAVTKTDTQ
jgi:hypothetical protein